MVELTYYPDDVLLRKAAPVEQINAEVRELVNEMFVVLREAQGLGLAAPQVGRPIRLFVVSVPAEEPRAFINPEILETSVEEVMLEEGCLSIPGMYANVQRHSAVRVQAYDTAGRPFTLGAEGMLARVIQHELDHLNGVLFWDHLPERRRERLQKKYRVPQSVRS